MTRNVVDLRLRATFGERQPCALQDPLTIAAGIGTEGAMNFAGGGGRCGGHKNFIRIA